MKLVCPECRRENEPERIYCHDCGARLDRSSLAKEKSTVEDPKATQRRLRSMMDARGVKMRQRFFQGSKLVLGALAVAALVQMFRPPDVPERPESSDMAMQIDLDLENASMTPGAPALRYSEEQVNAYLAYTLKGKKKALSSYLQFEQAIVGFEEAICRVTTERSFSGYSVFTTATFTPRLENGNLTARVTGGSIGRLPIHPALMQYGDFLFADIRTALDRNRRSIVKLAGIELHSKTVVFIPKQQPL